MKIYDEYVIRLMEAYLTGKLDDAGRKELEAWCGACEKNRKFFERVCREDRIAREVPLYAEVDGEKAFRHFQKRIRGRKWLRRLVRCAAVLLLPLGVVAVWQWMGMEVHRDTGQEIVPGTSRAVLTLAGGEQVCLQEGKPVEKRLEAMEVEQKEGVLSYQTVRPVQENAEAVGYNMLATDRGGEYQLVLSDGTRVFLNAVTSLKYPVVFGGGERRVELDGEAYFEVEKDAERPFYVVLDGMEVKVYGTSFNVNTHYQGKILTTLVEGKVGIRVKSTGAECILRPNQMAEFDREKEEVEVTDVDTYYYTAWRAGEFVFQNETIEEIMDRIAAVLR